ncbi:MAG: PucR family transcription regulator, partial [Frankiales bacterium]|nr:PucR family transcription regulator [Frankiales bacterium]
VTIEDMAARVIAYSRSGDEVDVLRRLSILGRSGPEDYLALLRTWGVYDRLAASEEVVEIAEHPESGVRRRLAVGVFAGTRQLGVIWVQQGTHEFGPHARQALIGAARITAEHLVGGASAFATRGNPRPGGLADLLSGRVADLPELAARGSRAPCAVAVVAVVDAAEAASGANETEPSDPAARRLLLGELTSILKLHAAGFRRNALVEVVEDQVCLLLPALESAGSASAFLAAALADAQRHLPLTVRAAIGPLVAQPADARRSLLGAERALSLAGAGAARSEDDRSVPITLFDSVRTRLVTEAASRAAATGQDPALPALDRLIEGQPAIARTLLSYLESGGQVAPTAVELGVHVTTVRYRLRRAAEVAELDLSDADDRLAAQLILRFAFRAREIKA